MFSLASSVNVICLCVIVTEPPEEARIHRNSRGMGVISFSVMYISMIHNIRKGDNQRNVIGIRSMYVRNENMLFTHLNGKFVERPIGCNQM
jgi:hypothetical protein